MADYDIEILKKDKVKREEVKLNCLKILKEISQIERIEVENKKIEKSFSIGCDICPTCGQTIKSKKKNLSF